MAKYRILRGTHVENGVRYSAQRSNYTHRPDAPHGHTSQRLADGGSVIETNADLLRHNAQGKIEPKFELVE